MAQLMSLVLDYLDQRSVCRLEQASSTLREAVQGSLLRLVMPPVATIRGRSDTCVDIAAIINRYPNILHLDLRNLNEHFDVASIVNKLAGLDVATFCAMANTGVISTPAPCLRTLLLPHDCRAHGRILLDAACNPELDPAVQQFLVAGLEQTDPAAIKVESSTSLSNKAAYLEATITVNDVHTGDELVFTVEWRKGGAGLDYCAMEEAYAEENDEHGRDCWASRFDSVHDVRGSPGPCLRPLLYKALSRVPGLLMSVRQRCCARRPRACRIPRLSSLWLKLILKRRVSWAADDQAPA